MTGEPLDVSNWAMDNKQEVRPSVFVLGLKLTPLPVDRHHRDGLSRCIEGSWSCRFSERYASSRNLPRFPSKAYEFQQTTPHATGTKDIPITIPSFPPCKVIS